MERLRVCLLCAIPFMMESIEEASIGVASFLKDYFPID